MRTLMLIGLTSLASILCAQNIKGQLSNNREFELGLVAKCEFPETKDLQWLAPTPSVVPGISIAWQVVRKVPRLKLTSELYYKRKTFEKEGLTSTIDPLSGFPGGSTRLFTRHNYKECASFSQFTYQLGFELEVYPRNPSRPFGYIGIRKVFSWPVQLSYAKTYEPNAPLGLPDQFYIEGGGKFDSGVYADVGLAVKFAKRWCFSLGISYLHLEPKPIWEEYNIGRSYIPGLDNRSALAMVMRVKQSWN